MSSTSVEVLRAVAEPVRWEIVQALREAPLCACDLVEQLAIPAPLLSHHMKVLRAVEVVHARRLGRRVEYTLDLATLDALAEAVTGKVESLATAGRGAP
jgi:ArsR family transcriptional regulator